MALKLMAIVVLLVAMAVPARAEQLPARFRDWFPISGWYGPNKEQVTSKVYEEMA